jgi:tRNA (adenine22-N1)-methyltransferase
MRELSLRLQTVLALLNETLCLGDIGSDHAFLVAAAVLQGKARCGIAVELGELPYRQSKKTVTALGLSELVDVRLGDGLAPLAPDEVQALCIAGLGGGTMRGILERGRGKLGQASQLVLQPNVDAGLLRSYLWESGFRVRDEAVVEDSGIIYQVMRAEPGSETIGYSPLELEYGRLNLRRFDATTARLIRRDLAHWRRVLVDLQAARQAGTHARSLWVSERVRALEEVLAGVS